MSKPATVRAEILEFLLERAGGRDRELRTSITALSEAWDAWRSEQGLSPAASGERNFRQSIARLEQTGRIELLRDGRTVTGLRVIKPAPPGQLERLRALERERATLAGRFLPAAPSAGRDLPSLRTPAINDYVRRRRALERARREFVTSGLDPARVPLDLDPLGEEALALKERVLRLEIELRAWREVGSERGIDIDARVAELLSAEASAAEPASTLVEERIAQRRQSRRPAAQRRTPARA